MGSDPNCRSQNDESSLGVDQRLGSDANYSLVSCSPLAIKEDTTTARWANEPLPLARVTQAKRSPADITRCKYVSISRAHRLFTTLRSLANQPLLVGRVLTSLAHDCVIAGLPDSRRARTSSGIGIAWRVA